MQKKPMHNCKKSRWLLLFIFLGSIGASTSLGESRPASCKLTIYVKSAGNHKPLAGAEVKVAMWRRFRNSKHSEWKPAWHKERYFHADGSGKIVLDPNTSIPSGNYKIPSNIGDNIEFMFAMTATCTGHTQAQQKAYMRKETPRPTSTFYLPVYRDN